MTTPYKLFIIIYTLLTVCACNDELKELQKPTSTGKDIYIVIPESGTRAILDLNDGKSVNWQDGDKVGIFHYVNGVCSAHAKNVPYTYDAENGKFKAEAGSATWSGTESDTHSLYVYYPWREDAKSPSAEKLFIQHTASQTYDAMASSWYTGNKYGFAYGRITDADFERPVTFEPLNQYLGILRLNIKNELNKTIKITKVDVINSTNNIRGSYAVSLVKYSNDGFPTHTFDDGVKKITITVENGFVLAGESIDIMIAIRPFDYSGTTFNTTITTDDEDSYTIEFNGGNIAKGGRASKDLSISTADESVPYTIGSLVNGGILYKISDDGLTGTVLYPLGEKKQWCINKDALYTPSMNNFNDGALNIAAMELIDPTLESFPAAAFCASLEGGHWYLPSLNELKDLFEIYNGQSTTESLYPSNLSDKEKTARTKFDNFIIACGGTLLNSQGENDGGDSAWSSNTKTTDGTQAQYLRWGKYLIGQTDRTSSSRFARCIKKINIETNEEITPEAGVVERYSPSLKTTYYKPVKIEASFSNAAADSRIWKEVKVRLIDLMTEFTPDQTLEGYKSSTNKYGSSTNLPRQTATGRFYVKKIDNRWWIIDPEGHLHHHRGVNCIRPGTSANNLKIFYNRFSNIQTWMKITWSELSGLGFHGAGAFSKDYYDDFRTYNATNSDRPYILSPSLSFLSQFKEKKIKSWPGGSSDNKIGLVLHPEWQNWCREYVKTEVAPYKGDPHTLGVFSDNEINFILSGEGLLPRLLSTPQDEYTYKGARQWCEENGIDSNDKSQITDLTNNRNFGAYLAEIYYKEVSKAIKDYDPGMLYLGSRLHGSQRLRPEIWAVAGKYCGIISVNYYGDWNVDLKANDGERIPGEPSRGHASLWEDWAGGKPYLVTEFYTKGIEDSDLNNMSGAGFSVRNQTARAFAYQHFTLGLLEAPACVGWHWFKYQDDEPEDNNNMGANKGIYDKNFRMYNNLGNYMKNLNIHTYELIEFFDSK